jgi:pyruvate formate lyase activating enzyme
MPKGLIFDIKRFAIHDGPGIRLTFFLTGCPLSCWWCHNPEGLREIPTEAKRCGSADSEQIEERTVTIPELLAEVAKEQIFIDESGGGVTFSGGEPMVQLDFLDEALAACREREIHTTVDTSGYVSAKAFERVAKKVDLFLYDLKLMDDQAHREYTGMSNKLIHENLRLLVRMGRQVIIRIPVVPGFTDSERNATDTAQFLIETGGIREVCLLPYHKAANAKYERLQLTNRIAGVEPPSGARMDRLRNMFEDKGFSVRIGG